MIEWIFAMTQKPFETWRRKFETNSGVRPLIEQLSSSFESRTTVSGIYGNSRWRVEVLRLSQLFFFRYRYR